LLLKFFDSIFRNFIDLILFAESLLNCLFTSSKRKDEAWKSKLLDKLCEISWGGVSKPIKDKLRGRWSLVDHNLNLLLDIGDRNISLERFILSSELKLALLGDDFHINDSVAKTLAHVLGESGLSSENSSNNDSELSLVSELLIENIEVPLVHGLESEFFLEKRINVEKTQIVVLDLHN